jgi:hypothetical protein
MLVIPMRDHHDTVIGVVQLINKKRDRDAVLWPTALVEEQVIPFTSVDEDLVESLTARRRSPSRTPLLKRDPRAVRHFVAGGGERVEQRDPTTPATPAGAILTVGLMEKVDQIQVGPLAASTTRATRSTRSATRAAARLRQGSRAGAYLRKERKLYAGQLIALRQRFAYILRSIEADYLRRGSPLESGDASPDGSRRSRRATRGAAEARACRAHGREGETSRPSWRRTRSRSR